MDLSGSSLTVLTEGDQSRGLGHVVRCLAHAEVWHAAGAEVHWQLDGDARARNLIVEAMPDAADRIVTGPWSSATVPLADFPTDVVLVDSYALTPSLARAIARKAEQAIFIDDVQALAYPPGYVLHPAPDLAPRQPDEARWLTGPVWQALRRPFREAPEPAQPKAEIENVLVLMGGTDASGRGPAVASQVARLLPRAEVRLVGATSSAFGPAWQGIGSLSAEALADEMKAADLAVSAAGQSVFELAALGVPTVMLGVAKNQIPNLEAWPGRAGFRNAGMVDHPDFDARLSRALAAMALPGTRSEVAYRAWTQVDGLGAIRLIHSLGRGL